MQAGFAEDGALVISGESAQDALALAGWHALWLRRSAQFRLVLPESFIRGTTKLALVDPPESRPAPLDEGDGL